MTERLKNARFQYEQTQGLIEACPWMQKGGQWKRMSWDEAVASIDGDEEWLVALYDASLDSTRNAVLLHARRVPIPAGWIVVRAGRVQDGDCYMCCDGRWRDAHGIDVDAPINTFHIVIRRDPQAGASP
jgi:hypothetical protein